jgi:hypothetical protein
MQIILWGLALLAGLALAVMVAMRLGPDLAAEFQAQSRAEVLSDSTRAQPMVTEASIAGLPAPVQRYMRVTGNVGKPRIASLDITFAAEMFSKPGDSGMAGTARQYDRFDPPKRLFFLPTRMKGLPVQVLHDYQGSAATMRVRLASLVTVVDAKGPELSRTETVTLLNDLAFFAPSWLADPRLQWTAIDDGSAFVTFTNGPHRVSATLIFDAAGDLVNFVSEDRGAMQDDGTLRITRWSTPMHGYATLDGRRYATDGKAIWHYPEGDFTYGHFKLVDLTTR